MAILKGQRAGSHSITVSYGGKTTTGTLVVNKIDPVLQFLPRQSEITYNGIARVIGCLEYTGDGEASYYVVKATSQPSVPAANASGWEYGESVPFTCLDPSTFEEYYFDRETVTSTGGGYVVTPNGTPAGAGTYYVFVKSTEGTSYNAVSPKYAGSYTIGKANQNAPNGCTGTMNVTYPDTASVTSASGGGQHGQAYYRSDPNGGTNYGTATTTPPTRSTAGTTTFIMYWGGDDNYNASRYSSSFLLFLNNRTVNLSKLTCNSDR